MTAFIEAATRLSIRRSRQIWVCRDCRGRLHLLVAHRRGCTLLGRAIGAMWVPE